ncbi:GNAT family N-acetyltransferase [Aquimarina muelleri]|uniref:GNAT family N-acetyltransferase n=1 Tax=Aquimarina muelleri TaxID=279356 RepID=UPI003F686490
MKEISSIIDANIENLTSLWKTASVPFDSYYKTPGFEYCKIKDSDWPNRLWFSRNLKENDIDLVKEIIRSGNLTIPYWNTKNKNEDVLFLKNHFELKFKQVAMYLKPDTYFEIGNEIKIKRIHKTLEMKLWTDLYPKAFGYKISENILVNTYKDIHYYLAYYNDEPIGTAILFQTNNIVGVHGVGVVHQMRKRGFAAQIMKSLINVAIINNMDYVMLQASDMGKNVYLKLGFKELFEIRNYVAR